MQGNALFIFAGGLLLFLIIKILLRIPGFILAHKFEKLGNMKGLTKNDIIKKVGDFNSISYIEDGSVCVWQSAGYMISIVFDSNDNFLKIASEIKPK